MWQKTKNLYHLGQAITAHITYGFPAKGPIFIGITGTDGKTTTASLLYHILQKSGKKVALVSTVSAIINGKVLETGFHVTTPDAWTLLRYIRLAKKSGARYIILETTSHALDQNRVFGIPFSLSILTNITHEHLDYHKTYENYVNAKLKLLKNSKVAIVNMDDKSYDNIKRKMRNGILGEKNEKIITYGMGDNVNINPHLFPFKSNLLGEFNRYNCLAAIAACIELEIDPLVIRSGLADFIPPTGRTEIVFDKEFTVMIDFAHTPNSIENILQTVKNDIKPRGKIIHVFGSAGRRDASKRPLMGKASDAYAEIIILTSEDPRDEKIENIFANIISGIKKHEERIKEKTLFTIPDRQEAIDKALQLARKGDIVVITGKGHEQSMNLGAGEIAWSDHTAVKVALKKLYEKN